MTDFKNRRTIRKYTSQDISDEMLNDMILTASRAATMGNMQLYSVIVTRDAEMKKKLAPLHFNQPMVTQAPVVLTFCADFNRFCKWCDQRKAVPGYDNMLSFMNAVYDTSLFTQSFCTIAEEKGLGTCFLGTTAYTPDKIIELLEMPKLTFPVATITVGWPDENPEQPDRLPLKGIIHEEVYRDYKPADIDDIYGYKESLEENRHFVEINKKETLAQVFTDLRYTKSDNEAMSANFMETLRRQGFID